MDKIIKQKTEIDMKNKITQRFDDLIEEGNQLINKFVKDKTGYLDGIKAKDISTFQAWISSVNNLICLVTRENSPYYKESNRFITQASKSSGISPYIIRKMLGLLESAKKEWNEGMLREIEYIIVAETFDDFLDHSVAYHKAGKHIESSVLASAVLEDVIKKTAEKNSIETNGKSLEPLINDLKSATVFTPVKAKRVKVYAGIRNKAFHAEWNKFDIKDVGEMIKGIRELIEEFL